ncbi:MAG: acylneuraminate cytidylyltransferase family protein [Deltaproteobacteria bacterium]|nr:acylneuraminate cytidylyltransferase family protein [Deltaproteobacteria bacterium]MBW2642399.1 acylneuraminate cytidylyltransferase family protein [Deltaproteobacteria bacterium]
MLNGKSILVVVPARGGSKGVKLKNIRKINGVPLVALVGHVVRQLPYVDRAVVSTDHPEIAEIAEKSGLDVPFMRPEQLSGDVVADGHVLHHALMECEKVYNRKFDIIIMLQPTSPFRKPFHVTETVEKLIKGRYDAVWTVSETDSKAHPLKQLVIRNDILDFYDPAGAKIIARQQLTPVYHKNGVAYVMTRDCILNKEIKGGRTSFVVIEELMVNIDTEFDFKLAEFILQQNGDSNKLART